MPMYSAEHDAKLKTKITLEDEAVLNKQYLIGNIKTISELQSAPLVYSAIIIKLH